jgi:hypothetical protein
VSGWARVPQRAAFPEQGRKRHRGSKTDLNCYEVQFEILDYEHRERGWRVRWFVITRPDPEMALACAKDLVAHMYASHGIRSYQVTFKHGSAAHPKGGL